MNPFCEYMNSPLGELEICASENGLFSMLFVETKEHKIPKKETLPNKITTETKKQLDAYFNKSLKEFDIPIEPAGTEFQLKVWKELQKIPFSKTLSYLHLAKKLGDEKTIRAAASANGKNPIAIIIPCHRVIGTNGSLTGYAGDLWRKEWLLEHESGVKSLKLF